MKFPLRVITLFFLLLPWACKEDNPYRIPYVLVNFYVYPTTIDSDLGVSRFKYFPNYGYRGVMVYRMNTDQFLAYDRACTYDTENPAAVVAVDASGLVAVCPVCKTQYLLTDGYPFKGPARNPLLPYHTNWDGFKLLVTN